MKTLIVKCAWCKKVIKAGDDNEKISHNICENCAEEIREEILQFKREQKELEEMNM